VLPPESIGAGSIDMRWSSARFPSEGLISGGLRHRAGHFSTLQAILEVWPPVGLALVMVRPKAAMSVLRDRGAPIAGT